MLILVARLIASNLNENIAAEVTTEELSNDAAIARNQVHARTSDLIKAKMITTPDEVPTGLCSTELNHFFKGLVPSDSRGSSV